MTKELEKAVGDLPQGETKPAATAPKADAKKRPTGAANQVVIENERDARMGATFAVFRDAAEVDGMEQGDTVALVNGQGDKFGEAEVLSVTNGSWDELKQMSVDEVTFGGSRFSHLEAQEMLDGNIRQMYPDRKANAKLAVIYLRREA